MHKQSFSHSVEGILLRYNNFLERSPSAPILKTHLTASGSAILPRGMKSLLSSPESSAHYSHYPQTRHCTWQPPLAQLPCRHYSNYKPFKNKNGRNGHHRMSCLWKLPFLRLTDFTPFLSAQSQRSRLQIGIRR